MPWLESLGRHGAALLVGGASLLPLPGLAAELEDAFGYLVDVPYPNIQLGDCGAQNYCEVGLVPRPHPDIDTYFVQLNSGWFVCAVRGAIEGGDEWSTIGLARRIEAQLDEVLDDRERVHEPPKVGTEFIDLIERRNTIRRWQPSGPLLDVVLLRVTSTRIDLIFTFQRSADCDHVPREVNPFARPAPAIGPGG